MASSLGTYSRTTKPRAKPISQSEWAKYRGQITTLYIEEGKDLDKVMAIMAKQGFRPQKCQYKSQFKLWKLRKNEKQVRQLANPDDLLGVEERIQRWIRDSEYLGTMNELSLRTARERCLLWGLGLRMLQDGENDLVQYALSLYDIESVVKAPRLKTLPGQTGWGFDNLHALRTDDIYSIFYCIHKASCTLQAEDMRLDAHCAHLSHGICGSTYSSLYQPPLCQQTPDSPAAKFTKFVLGMMLANRNANLNLREGTWEYGAKVFRATILDRGLEIVKEYDPSIYECARMWSAKLPKDLDWGGYEEEVWCEDLCDIVWKLQESPICLVSSETS